MKSLLAGGAALGALLFLFPVPSLGHGGTYRGPGDTVPPGGSGGGTPGPGSTTPGPNGPSAPPSGGGPVGPASTPGATPGQPGPGTGPRTPTDFGGVDLSAWDFWWGYNREPYLALKSHIHGPRVATSSDEFFLGQGQRDDLRTTLRPSEALVRGRVVPALLDVLERETDNDLVTGAMIALAKIGDIRREDGTSLLYERFVPFLRSGSQEVSETAALSLGILGDRVSVPLLVALMADEPLGRRAVGGKEVPVGTRAFAAYGLGLVAHRTSEDELRSAIAARLVAVLEGPRQARPDLKVAVVSSLGQCQLPWDTAWTPTGGPHDPAEICTSREALVEYLLGLLPADVRAESDTRSPEVRAHVPLAVARLLDDPAAPAETYTRLRTHAAETMLAVLGRGSRDKKLVEQSCVLGLGRIGSAGGGDLDQRIQRSLLRLAADAADDQTEFFALMSLARAGSRPGAGDSGEERYALASTVQKELLQQLARAKSGKAPWVGLALGVFGRGLLDHGRLVDPAIRRALVIKLDDCRRPPEAGAYGLALGLIGAADQSEVLLDRFEHFSGSPGTQGYLAVGLGLMDARSARERLSEAVAAAVRRPELMRSGAVALGLLGDSDLVPMLIEMLGAARATASQAAVASALGRIGDARAIDPLLEMLRDDPKKLTKSARGFAAVALGIVCDKEALPFNTKFAVDVNYRAATRTLTSPGGRGLLDLL